MEFLQYDTDTNKWSPKSLDTNYYNVTSANFVAGTLDGGTIEDTKHSDAAYDGVTINISEVSNAPGLDVRINFTNVSNFQQGIMRYKTSELKGEHPKIQMWDYENNRWKSYPPVAETDSFAIIEEPVFNSDRLLENGTAQMRIYKEENGNTNNKYYIDWITVADGFDVPTGEETDPIWSSEKNDYYNKTQINDSYLENDGDTITGSLTFKNNTEENKIYTNDQGTLVFEV